MIQTLAQPETTSSFGYWVRRQRLALDLTQADLARMVSCATVTISKLERDERRPSRQMANLLADRLAIPPDQRDRFLAVALGELAADRMVLVFVNQKARHLIIRKRVSWMDRTLKVIMRKRVIRS